MPYIIEQNECGGVGWESKRWVPNKKTSIVEEESTSPLSLSPEFKELSERLYAAEQKLRNYDKKCFAFESALETRRFKIFNSKFEEYDFSSWGTEPTPAIPQYNKKHNSIWCFFYVNISDEELMVDKGYDTLEQLEHYKSQNPYLTNEIRLTFTVYFKENTDIIDSILVSE